MLSILNGLAHGYVAIPVILACRRAGLFKILQPHESLSWQAIVDGLQANSGHLRVALRLLESLGWVERTEGDGYRLTGESRKQAQVPDDVLHLLDIPFTAYLDEAGGALDVQPWLKRSLDGWGVDDDQLRGFLDGLIVLPLFLALRSSGSPHASNPLLGVPESRRGALEAFLLGKDWGKGEGDAFELSESGGFLKERILNAGVVMSYRPLLQKLDDLIFGDCASAFALDDRGDETHIDRTLNVIGSGFQHQRYFADMEEIILSIFDNDDFDRQPRYVADMGCGDGTLLKRVYEVICGSRRGAVLDKYPLKLIGADINRKSLEQTGLALQGIEHQVIVGDIGDPEGLIDGLRKIGISDPENALHIRTFLDHDRPFISPSSGAAAPLEHDGVYVDRLGREINPNVAYQSLVEHLQRWSSVAGKHGLVVLEVHSLPASTVRAHLSSENLHFDAIQAFSGQLMTAADEFLMAAANAGLFARHEFVRNYPKTLPYTRITLNFLESRNYRIRFPRVDDLEALYRLEESCWEPALRAPPGIIRDRVENNPQGQLVVEQQAHVVGVIYSQRLAKAEDVGALAAGDAHRLHFPGGPVVQLLAINILPELQDQQLGDQLLEQMLQRCAVLSGVTAVVGVTRCKAFAEHPGVELVDYVSMRNPHGRLIDPILRFHELHGARIGRLVEDYRPADAPNRGYGVVVEYEVRDRQRKNAARQPQVLVQEPASTQRVQDMQSIERTVTKAIVGLLGTARAERSFSRVSPVMEMGLDSADLLELAETISAQFKFKLTPTFFFEHNTCENIAKALAQRLTGASSQAEGGLSGSGPLHLEWAAKDARRPRDAAPPREEERPCTTDGGVAIVGIACRLAGGIQSPDELWSALQAARDVVGPLPAGRWHWPADIDPATTHPGIDRGGFIEDIACFEPALFRISPREAELMDPQQRLLLELSWTCMENAGYGTGQLAGSNTGVYVGASGSDYQLLLNECMETVDAHRGVNTSVAALPNRISYFYDFHGPSVQIDTACSSSLVSLSYAVQALRAGLCDQALVAGVHLMCHPANSVAYYKAGMLSRTGTCKTFDATADGYARSEGAVVMMLKPLSRALADRDNIHAVIKGVAVNHGGKSGGLTVPNPKRQADLVCAAFADAKVDAHTVSYIEAHGTGTPLGDPIEVEGLKQAFARMEDGLILAKNCGIGSLKTNLGHLEAAAGIAGLLKVVLSLRHRQLPASLHVSALNPKLELSATPFHVVDSQRAWEGSPGVPLRAGVSSFGSGGTNAHAVLEEYRDQERHEDAVSFAHPSIVVLSARSQERLREQASQLLTALQDPAQPGCALKRLTDIAYTLQVGREAMEWRLACVAESLPHLRDRLQAYLAGEEDVADLYRGQARQLKETLAFFAEEELQEAIGKWIERGRLGKLAELWTKGLALDWGRLYAGYERHPRRIELPGYSFAKERYWVDAGAARAAAGQDAANPSGAVPGPGHWLHPLVQRNTSDLGRQRFSSWLSGEEFFLREHVVAGRRVLPAAAQLELAREAVLRSLADDATNAQPQLENVVFTRPVVVETAGLDLHIALEMAQDGAIEWEIYSHVLADGSAPSDDKAARETVVHSQGRAVLGDDRPQAQPDRIDIAGLRGRGVQMLAPSARGPEFRAICGQRTGGAGRSL